MGQSPSCSRICTKSCSTIINAPSAEVRQCLIQFDAVCIWARAYITDIEGAAPTQSTVSSTTDPAARSGSKNDDFHPEGPDVDDILKITLATGEHYFVRITENTPNTLKWEGGQEVVLDKPFDLVGEHTFTFESVLGGKTRLIQTLHYEDKYDAGPEHRCTDEQWHVQVIEKTDIGKMILFNEELKQAAEEEWQASFEDESEVESGSLPIEISNVLHHAELRDASNDHQVRGQSVTAFDKKITDRHFETNVKAELRDRLAAVVKGQERLYRAKVAEDHTLHQSYDDWFNSYRKQIEISDKRKPEADLCKAAQNLRIRGRKGAETNVAEESGVGGRPRIIWEDWEDLLRASNQGHASTGSEAARGEDQSTSAGRK